MSGISIVKSLTIKGDFFPLLKLAVPLVLIGIMESSMNFFENIFLAHLGPEVLAAGALVAWLFLTLIVILFGIFGAVNILVAHKYGAKDIAGISHVLRDGMVLAMLLVVPVFLLIWNIAPLFLMLGQRPTLVILATAYLHALAWGLLPKFILIVLFEFILGLGHARIITVYTMLTIPIYLGFSYVLIFGKFGFPFLGISGAGWGMTIGDWLSAIMLSVYLVSNKNYRVYLTSILTTTKLTYLWEILQLGLPMGMMYCVEVGYFFAMTLLMGLIGVQSLAANQVTLQYMGPLMGSIFYIAQSTTVRMGHQLGANQVAIAERVSYTGIVLAIIYMSIVAIIYWMFPECLIAIDFNLQDPVNFETIQLAKRFLCIAAFFQIIESIRISLFGALRGLKDTRFTLMTSIISFWCIALPAGYWLSIHLKLGGIGFWWAMLVSACFSVVMLYRRFRVKMVHSYILHTT